jgi:hypothetical protein
VQFEDETRAAISLLCQERPPNIASYTVTLTPTHFPPLMDAANDGGARKMFQSRENISHRRPVIVLAQAICAMMFPLIAQAQVRSDDAPSRASPTREFPGGASGTSNFAPMARPKAPAMSPGTEGRQLTAQQCANLVRRAQAVETVKQSDDYEFCIAHYPNAANTATGSPSSADAPSK